MNWDIKLYEKENGDEPVKNFIAALPPKHKAKALWEIELLSLHGTSLKMPYVESIKGDRYKGLMELRVQQGNDVSRIFYFLPVGNKFILLHGFVKKTQKTPQKELETALRYKEDYMRRCSHE